MRQDSEPRLEAPGRLRLLDRGDQIGQRATLHAAPALCGRDHQANREMDLPTLGGPRKTTFSRRSTHGTLHLAFGLGAWGRHARDVERQWPAKQRNSRLWISAPPWSRRARVITAFI